MTKVVVSGYSSFDHVISVDAPPVPNRTTLMRRQLDGGWARDGGCAAFVAKPIARAGISVNVITWVGDDPEGERYVALLQAAGIGIEGVAVVPGGRTPSCILIYDSQGGCICLFDLGVGQEVGLNETQARLIGEADWACIAVGPRRGTEEVLAALSPRTKLAWAVKADSDSVPTRLRCALAERADVICYNSEERKFLNEAFKGREPLAHARLLVETRGSEGVLAMAGGEACVIPVNRVNAVDPTGAGDTFVGGMLSRLIEDPSRVSAAVLAGTTAARELLLSRLHMPSFRDRDPVPA